MSQSPYPSSDRPEDTIVDRIDVVDPAPDSSPGPTPDPAAPSTSDTAKAEGAEVKDTAVDAGRQVADTAKSEAQNVVDEVKDQSRRLVDQTTTELSSQAGGQQQRLASAVGGYADELRTMAGNADGGSPLTGLVHQLADQGERASSWLSTREPEDVLAEVRSFARRRPAAFLAIAFGAGLVAGRLSRGLFADAKGGDPMVASQSATSSPPQFEADRPPLSLEEVPTSGTGAGPTFDDPVDDPSRPVAPLPGAVGGASVAPGGVTR